MSSLINSALSGLTAAQNALSVTSNNISNYAVPGHSRQTVILSQALSTQLGNQYYGNGVRGAVVNREYDQYIATQLRGAAAISSGLTARYNQIALIDNRLADSKTSLSATMQNFFKNLQNVVNSANDPSARTALLGSAKELVNQFRTSDDFLRSQAQGINITIANSVKQINTYSEQIATLNTQIARLKGSAAGNAPSDLLDKRDQLVNQLNQLIGVNVSIQDGGSYIISIAGGETLVQGDNYTQLAAVSSAADAARTTVATIDPRTGTRTEIDEKQLTTGSLGGIIQFRSQQLDGARNQLNQLALALSSHFNEQHKQGFDVNGKSGVDFFRFGPASFVSDAHNSGNASLSITRTNTSEVKASDYRLYYDGVHWSVTRLADNSTVKATVGNDANNNPVLSFDGLQIAISGSAHASDRFIIKPVSDVISGMSINVTDEKQIAAAGSATTGVSDNRNVQKLLDLQGEKVVNGNSTLTQAYASLVANVGNQTSSLKTSSTIQEGVVNQLTARQQATSGVNLDEEYASLMRYQQYYVANAQVMQTASAVFNSLISAFK